MTSTQIPMSSSCVGLSIYLIANEWVCSAEYQNEGSFIGWGSTPILAWDQMSHNRMQMIPRHHSVSLKNKERMRDSIPSYDINLGDF